MHAPACAAPAPCCILAVHCACKQRLTIIIFVSEGSRVAVAIACSGGVRRERRRWECRTCTYLNLPHLLRCELCDVPRLGPLSGHAAGTLLLARHDCHWRATLLARMCDLTRGIVRSAVPIQCSRSSDPPRPEIVGIRPAANMRPVLLLSRSNDMLLTDGAGAGHRASQEQQTARIACHFGETPVSSDAAANAPLPKPPSRGGGVATGTLPASVVTRSDAAAAAAAAPAGAPTAEAAISDRQDVLNSTPEKLPWHCRCGLAIDHPCQDDSTSCRRIINKSGAQRVCAVSCDRDSAQSRCQPKPCIFSGLPCSA